VQHWLLLVYRIPREPTSGRVYAWRKLKQLGAVLLHDSVWLLPATPRTQEQFQWLAAEIVELGGEATCWRSELVLGCTNAELTAMFEAEIEPVYREILKSLKRKRPDLAALGRTYQQAQTRDYFASKLGQQVRAALLAARGKKER
jgi:hypothetical protein